MSLANLADVTVEIGFGVDAVGGNYFVLDDPVKGELGNVTYLLAPDTVFVDVTSVVAAVSIDRGRAREVDEYATGKATVVFNDNDRTFDPSYSGSPYDGQITPMRRIRVAWQNVDIFNGWVDDWSVTYEPGDQLSRVTAECVDGFSILANQQLAEVAAAYSGDLSGERITRVLDRTEVRFPSTRSIDDGTSILGDTTLGGNVLTYIQECARAEAGYLFVAADGTLTFRSRLSTLNAESEFVLSDDPAAGVPYRDVTQRSSADLLFTRVSGSSETTGVVVEDIDAAAEDEYFVRALDLGTLLTVNDAQTAAIVASYLARFSAPEVRFQTATVNMVAVSAAQVGQVVGLDLTDLVTVERSPLNVGATISKLSLIDGVSHRIVHGSWTVDLSFSNADTATYLTLDSATLGLLDTDRLAY